MQIRVSPSIFYIPIILLCFLPFSGFGQEGLKLKNLSLEEGLSQNSVLSMLKDEEGFMWFATQDGLNKFDGYSFTVFQNDPKDPQSLSHNYVQIIFRDSKKNFWVGTWGGGLNLFNKEKGTFKAFKHNPENPNTLSHNHVNGIQEDKEGNIWVATKKGLNRFNPQKGTFEVFRHDKGDPNSISHNDVSTLFIDSKGRVWAGTWGAGLNRYEPSTDSFTRFKNERQAPTSISHNIVRSIYEDSEGTIWIGTWGGLNRFNPSDETFTVFRPKIKKGGSSRQNYVSVIREDKNGNLLIGTWGGGLFVFDKERSDFETTSHEICDPESISVISSLYLDNEENVWISTMGNGIFYFNNRNDPFSTLQNTANITSSGQMLSNDDIQALYTDRKGDIWIGTVEGLNQYNPHIGNFNVYKREDIYKGEAGNFAKTTSLSSNSIRSIFEDRMGNLWIGTSDNGLNLFNRDSNTVVTYKNEKSNPKSLSNNDVRTIEEDRFGGLWVGTWGGGLNLLNPSNGTFKIFRNNPKNPKSLSDNYISVVYEDKKGVLWVGTQNGLNSYNRSTGNFKVYQSKPEDLSSLSNNEINCIYEDSHGNLWIGTQNGLNKFDRKNETFHSFRQTDGLPADRILTMVEDNKNNLWISTNKGLSKFNFEKKSFQNFDVRDGIQNGIFNFIVSEKDFDGKLYFGGIAGIAVFDPDSIRGNTFIPPVVITGITLFNKPFLPQTEITDNVPIEIPQKDAFFTIQFSALSYVLPEKNRYKYMLEGFDEDWVFSGTKREATYTNLSGGTYTFKVKGSNNNGIWNEKETSLKITIVPPWWKTVWFKILSALIIAVALVTGYRVQTFRIISKNRDLETRVVQRTKQIELQKREIEQNHDNLNKLNLEISQKNEELERKVNERTQELQARENQLRLITDALPVLISYVDQNRKFRFNNKTYEEWFGLSSGEIIDRNIWEVIGEESYEKAKPFVESALQGEFVQYEMEMPYRSAGNHFVSTYFVPHFEGEKVLGFYALITDITERKEIEQALANALKEAENKNLELVRINTDLDNFVYTASHDLRSPITNLEGLLHMIIKNLQGKITSFDEDVLEMMNKSVIRLKRTISELGEIAKVQKEFLPEEPLSFKEVINEVRADIIHDITESNAEIIEDIEIENINYPHKHLRSIIYNLVSNAIKYRSPGRFPRITIKTREVNNRIQLSIMDNGLGLEEGQLKKIFKMFKRLHTHVEGSGVGLYIVKRIVENNGGSILVESKHGEGTTFYVNF